MRVLVVGEGPHDIGLPNHCCERTRTGIDQPGWLHVYLKKLAKPGEAIEIVAFRNNAIVLTDKIRRTEKPLPERHGAKALAAREKARIEQFDLVIFMADTDSVDDREWDKHHACIKDGFSSVPEGPPGVACLPKCASESWLLSDEAAWNQLGLADPSALPDRPEALSGARGDPEGNHPHRLFARVCRSADVSDSRETRVEIAELSTMSTVARKCPKSFAAFWRDLANSGWAVDPGSELSPFRSPTAPALPT